MMNEGVEMTNLKDPQEPTYSKKRTIKILMQSLSIIFLVLLSISFGFGLTSTNLYLNQLNVPEQMKKYGDAYGILTEMCLHNIFLGGFLSTLFLSFVTRFTRKNLAIGAPALSTLAYFLMYYFDDLMVIFSGKIIIGLAAGMISVSVPSLLHDLSFENYSGVITGLHSTGICIGLVLGHGIVGLSKVIPFGYLGGFMAIFSAISTLLTCFVQVEDKASEDTEEKGILKLINDKRYRKPVLTLIFCHIGQHLTGVDFFTIATEKIFTDPGNYYQIVLTSLLIAIPVSILSSFLADKVGRKRILMLSCFLLSFVTLALTFSFFPEIKMYAYVTAYNLGVATVPWIIINELLPQEYKKAGATLALLTNWGSGYIVNWISFTLFSFLGNYVWTVFSVLTFLMGMYTHFFVPETKDFLNTGIEKLGRLLNTV